MEILCNTETSIRCLINNRADVFQSVSLFLEQIRQKKEKIFILVDHNTKHHCLPVLLSNVPALQFAEIIDTEDGEENKTLKNVQKIWNRIIASGSGRSALLINLGGGVITDMGGFAASTIKRGIPYINIPTTLMGMVDASIGGKTGINDGRIKNQIGTFSLPAYVFIYPGFLETLPEVHLRSGFGEIIKYGLIADEHLWKKVRNLSFDKIREDSDLLRTIIEKSIKIKTTLVNEDFSEHGRRAILNFGHTIGHALESLSFLEKNVSISHGHAVALGMICESYISCELAGLPVECSKEIRETILKNFDYIELRNEDIPVLLEIMESDKKKSGGEICMSLIEKPGKAVYGVPVSYQEIKKSLHNYIISGAAVV